MTTLNLQVFQGQDDAFENADNTGFDRTGTVVSAWASATASLRKNGGTLFLVATIPARALIIAANLQPSVSVGNINIDIHTQADDDPDDFLSTQDVTDRPLSTASVLWVDPSVGVGFQSAPDISTVIQERVDSAGWVSGANIVVLWRGRTDTESQFDWHTFEFNPANATKLDIDYIEVEREAGAVAGEALGATHIRPARVAAY